MKRFALVSIALAVLLLVAVTGYVWPGFLTQTDTVVAGTIAEIESNNVTYLPSPGVFVVATAEGFVALDDDSRHVGDRVLFCSLNDTFFSPAHGERFDRQGRYLYGPGQGDMGRFPVSVRSGEVVVDLSSGPALFPRSIGSELVRSPGCESAGSESPAGFYKADAS